MLDRGAVRLEFPSKWIVKQHPDSVQIHDSEPPNDDCVVSVSRVQTPGNAGDVPLRDLVAALVAADERQILNSAEIVQVERGDLNIAWSEVRYIEPEKKREAFSRIAIGRGSGVHCRAELAHAGPVRRELISEKADRVVTLHKDSGAVQCSVGGRELESFVVLRQR